MALVATAVTAAESPPPGAPANAPAAPTGSAVRQIDPFIVSAERYVDPFGPVPVLGFSLGFPGTGLLSKPYETTKAVVTAARAPQEPHTIAPTAGVLLADALRASPALTLEGILQQAPGGGGPRRTGTTGWQASLLLLDGVPLNDPFSGGVVWMKAPRDGLARAEVIAGGGANVWGNASADGVTQLFTRRIRGELVFVRLPPPPGSPPTVEGRLVMGGRATLHTRTELGDDGTRSLEFSAVYPIQPGTLQLLGRVYRTEGYIPVAPAQRGSIDQPAWHRHRWLSARWHQALGANVELLLSVRGFEEQQGQGTPLQKSATRERFASATLAGEVGLHFRWQAVAYGQTQSGANTVSRANPARSAESPVCDQFAAPATAVGVAWTGTWKPGGNSNAESPRTSLGADVRQVRGETRENFALAAGHWTRQRLAGGSQSEAGLYGLHERPLGETWRVHAGARIDRLQQDEGHRFETDYTTGAVYRADRPPDASEVLLSPGTGLVWSPSRRWRWRASGQHGFRRPTLAERFRPAYDGPDFTEARAALHPERSTSAELGGTWTISTLRPPLVPAFEPARPAGRKSAPKPPRPVETTLFTATATLFQRELHDGISAVIDFGALPPSGLTPDGGVSRQRLNLERSRSRGLELSAYWSPASTLTLTGDLVLQETAVRRAPVAPSLVGRRLPGVPRQHALLGLTWQTPAKWVVLPRLHYTSRQFADAENRLRLGRAAVFDLGVSRLLTRQLELFVTVENLAQARVETTRRADGTVYLGMPRRTLGGLRGTW